MALISWFGESGSQGTFICETPENALDLSYVSNVADMFTEFARDGRTAILTANVQVDGLAHALLQKLRPDIRASHILDLLDLGRLSTVQELHLPDLRRAISQMLQEPTDG